ncbi:unnamed protein product, partial [marine sediment metagenome]
MYLLGERIKKKKRVIVKNPYDNSVVDTLGQSDE